jgi:hypothetical protein
VSAHDAVVALARDLVEEIAAGRAVELAAAMGGPGTPAAMGGPGTPAAQRPPPPPPKGAAAVHPQLGSHLDRLPGDTISGLAYNHLTPPGQPPIAGQ